jgi:hypothetical protein
VARRRQESARGVIKRELGRLDGERGNVQRVGMNGVRIGYPLGIRHSDLGSIGKNTSRSKGLR